MSYKNCIDAMAHSKCRKSLGKKKMMGELHKKDATKANGASVVGAHKATKTTQNIAAMMAPVMKLRKKN